MSRQLPELIEPLRLAELRRSLKGDIALKRMKRLAASLMTDEGMANVELNFAYDDTGLPTVSGFVKAELTLCCQRCMEPMVHSVQSRFRLGLVRNDQQAENLAARYEPFLVAEDKSSLTEMVEDELILSLPAVPRHDIEHCPAGDRFLSEQNAETEPGHGDDDRQQQTEKPNPFAVLEQLKSKPEK